jgi:hypothetical protein
MKTTEYFKYLPSYAELAFRLALLGLNDKDMAVAMNVSHSNFDYWKRTKSRFRSKLARGRTLANAKVAQALFISCMDRWVEEEEVHVIDHCIHRIKVKKFIKGDVKAQTKWLALKDRVNWSEIKQLEVTNNVNVRVATLDLTDFTKEELMLMNKLNIKKQLGEHNDEPIG